MTTERILLTEILFKLSYKDRRSVIRWCSKNGVNLFKDKGTNRWFALKNEFEKAFAPNRNSFDVLNSTMSFFSNYHQTQSVKHLEYRPQGKIEKQFLSILQSVKSAL